MTMRRLPEVTNLIAPPGAIVGGAEEEQIVSVTGDLATVLIDGVASYWVVWSSAPYSGTMSGIFSPAVTDGIASVIISGVSFSWAVTPTIPGSGTTAMVTVDGGLGSFTLSAVDYSFTVFPFLP
jgi:hypothetical protein